MIFNDVDEDRLSLLGFGTMRLALNEDKTINQEEVEKMVKYALDNGVNYFDTAFPYHEGLSEIAIGKALKKYPRDSFRLASKYPGHQTASSYNPKEIFEKQLEKCQVEYFDYYLLHNVCESCFDVYEDEKWGIIDYFVKQKELGRIKHLGFSSHAQADNLDKFISRHEGLFEFCQVQLNYLDWTLQEGKKKYEILEKHHMPIWVMEPVRGGKLVTTLAESDKEKLKEFRPNESVASFAFRFLMQYPSIKMILSGMSSMEQMIDNIKTFDKDIPLTNEENKYLLELAEKLKQSIPCTACRYCVEGCPMQLDISTLIASLNDLKFANSFTAPMLIESLPDDKKPSACIACGKCTRICPQKIDVPKAMRELSDIYDKTVKWSEICKQREEAAKKLK